ncbi:MAG: ABC transporter permease [Spirochaetales bacterium]|nr:ABC transporter permease [Spirochaetales bacterium]
MKHVLKYIITRVILTIPMVFILLTFVFIILRIMPGDPVSAMLGAHAPEYVIQEKKEALGLNKPVYIQYVEYLAQLARFDFGESMIFKQKVSSPIIEKLPATIELGIFGMLFSLVIGIPPGAFAARKRRSLPDFGIRLYGNIVWCIPVYWLGLMLQLVFGIWLDIFPIAGRTGTKVFPSLFERTGFYLIDTLITGNITAFLDVLYHIFLPALTLGIYLSGVYIRLTRANMIDILKSDFILAARARGIPENKIVYNYALKNAFIPILTMMGLQFALLIGGAILTETTFSWPGMGRLLLERIYSRDYPTIQGIIVVFALGISMISLIVDIIYALVDPRIKY